IGPRHQAVPGAIEMLQLLFAQPGQGELFDQLVQHHAMQVVQLGPGQLAAAYPIQRGTIAGTPAVRKLAPIDVITFALSQQLSSADNRSTPVHHRAEYVEYQSPDASDGRGLSCKDSLSIDHPGRQHSRRG